MLEIEPGLTIWTIVIFIILLFLLKKYAYKPINNLIKKQENTIRGAIERATQLRMEAEENKKQSEKLLDQARIESRKIIDDALEKAEKIKEGISDEARKSATQLLEKAKQEIDREKAKAKKDLERILVDIAADFTEKILKRKVTIDDQRKLIEESLKNIGDRLS